MRIGARDGMRVKQYQDYFESLGITKEVYNRLYIQMGAQTRLMNDTLIIWYKDDAWKIERVHIDNRVILWHNNYYVDKNYARVFYGGFHKQFPEGVTVSFKTALKHIEGYAPTVHIVEKKIKKIQLQIDAAREYTLSAIGWIFVSSLSEKEPSIFSTNDMCSPTIVLYSRELYMVQHMHFSETDKFELTVRDGKALMHRMIHGAECSSASSFCQYHHSLIC